ncbi:MAG: hypothetical protein Q7T33_15405 [Dehalococcoidia bacterium]|nr:hypothetical protein [Dehalococcoidia bacterium]
MSRTAFRPRSLRSVVVGLIATAAIGVAAGALSAWLLASGGPEAPVTAPPVAAEAVYGPDGRLLGAAQPYDPAVSFPAKLSGLGQTPSRLVFDKSGRLWFPTFTGTSSGNRLYRYDPAADSLTSYNLPDSPGSPVLSGPALAPNGHIVLAYGYLVLDVDPEAGSWDPVQLPAPPASFSQQSGESGTWVTDVAVAADGMAYVARMNTTAVTSADLAARSVTEIPIPAGFGTVMFLAAGIDGVYLSNWGGGTGGKPQLARLSPGGAFTPLEGGASGLAALPSGSVLATTLERAILPLGSASSVALPPGLAANLGGIRDFAAADANSGALWLAGRESGTVVRFDPVAGSGRVYQLPSYLIRGSAVPCPPDFPCKDVVSKTRVNGLAVGPNGNLYFSDNDVGRIGVIRP